MLVVKDSSIVTHCNTVAEGARHVLKWTLDYQAGKLYVNGNLDTITYRSKHMYPDDKNAFNAEEMYREVEHRLVTIAKRKGYSFYREI